MIAHSRGGAHPRLLRREHCHIMQANGQSQALNMMYPYPPLKVRSAAEPGRPTADVTPAKAGAPSPVAAI